MSFEELKNKIKEIALTLPESEYHKSVLIDVNNREQVLSINDIIVTTIPNTSGSEEDGDTHTLVILKAGDDEDELE